MELAKDTYFVLECCRLIFSHNSLLELKIKELIIWSDVGKHFRNSMLADFLANLPINYKINAVHNFFVEAHGKNICDVHFSQVKLF